MKGSVAWVETGAGMWRKGMGDERKGMGDERKGMGDEVKEASVKGIKSPLPKADIHVPKHRKRLLKQDNWRFLLEKSFHENIFGVTLQP